jgi:peptidoglycan/LPS O-acetylase OafA/YrhL
MLLGSGARHLKSSYIADLDGLRAKAILTVFTGHLFPKVIANSVGVDIFFVLSGFLKDGAPGSTSG